MDACILAEKGERSSNMQLLRQDQDQALECPRDVETFIKGLGQGPIVSNAVDAFLCIALACRISLKFS